MNPEAIQQALREADLDGWLFYDFQNRDPIGYRILGLSLLEEKRVDESRLALSRAFVMDSLDAEIAFFLGSACRWSKYEEKAVEYYLKAIELLKPLPGQMKNIHMELAELYKVLHRFDEALGSYHDAYSHDTLDHFMIFNIAQVYDQNLHQKRKAIQYYEKYVSMCRNKKEKKEVQSWIQHLKKQRF